MKKQVKLMKFVSLFLVSLLIISGNIVFANQFEDISNEKSNLQEHIDIDEGVLSPLVPEAKTINEISEEPSEIYETSPDPVGEQNEVTIVLDTQGGNPLQPISLETGNSVDELPVPFKEDAVFIGWFNENDESVKFPLKVEGNITLYARWENQPLESETVLPQPPTESDLANELITISFDTRGGNPIDSLNADKGSSLSDLPTPLKGDELFLGWHTENGEPVILPLEVTENITLYALWDEQAFIPANPDHLTEFDDSPYGGEINYWLYPESSFPALAALQSLRTAANNPPIIGTDHPTSPGEAMLFKEVKPVDGKVNTWDVKLRIEGKNKPTTSDVILVIDTSGSMDKNDRMTAAKSAANQFIDTLLPSETTRIGIVSFASRVSEEKGLIDDATSLKNAVNGLEAGGGTFTQAGVKQAEAMLNNSDADNKHIVLLSDGEPTYSYKLNNPDDYLDPYGNDFETNTEAPSLAYSYPTREGNGSDLRSRYNWPSTPRKYYNHGNSAIAEAGFAKAAGYRVWTIALEVDETGQYVLDNMASPNSYYTADPTSLNTVFAEIAGQIGSAVKDATVEDPMGVGFEIPSGEVTNITVSQGTPTYENNRISWSPGTLTQPISEGSDVNYAELTYTIEITDDILSQTPDANDLYPTNGDAQISYIDADGQPQTASFPVPKVNPVLYKVIKVLQDKDGNEITADRDFTIKVVNDSENTTREYVLNTSSLNSTKLLTDLRYAVDYSFEELGDLSDYDVKYYLNGQETEDRNFVITDGNTEDITIEVVNKEKPGSLTITKVLDQSLAQTPLSLDSSTDHSSVSFDFTVTGPDGYSESFSLPNDGSWTKELTGLARGEYTVTEATTPDYETSIQVNDDDPISSNSAIVTIEIGSLSQSMIVTNKQTENYSVMARKIWEGGPTDKPGIWFQLIRVNADSTETMIGSPRQVTDSNDVLWNQKDDDVSEDDFVRYDPEGNEYVYRVQEVDAEGNDFAPENYSKAENGLTVTNTYNKRTEVQVTKAWADGDNQDDVRPESVIIKLLADGVDSEKTLTLTASNNWTDTFTDLDEYANGKLIEYTVEEVSIGEGYVSSVTGTAADGYTVTNSRTPETITVEGSKKWDDNDNQDGKRPDSITIRLLKNGEEINQKTVTEEDGWAWSFADLAKFEDGELINYTVTEDAVDEYSTEVSGYNVINKHTPVKTSVQVTKAWADRDNQDGVRPESVTIKLLADGVETEKTLTLTSTNNWTGTFTDLDEYAEGELISYTVEELSIGEGYVSSVAGTAADGYTVTNSRTPETIVVAGNKTWDDNDNQDGKRPDSITIRLLKNGEEIGQKSVTEEDGWAWSFADLAKFEDGELINYTVTEDAVDEYSTEVSGYNVINKRTPSKTSVQVTKAWADGNNQDGVRPESVTIKLLADGVETEKTLTLTATNNWTDTFTDLDEYANGQLIEYTVEEVEVENGYVSSVAGTAAEGYTVTNSRTPETIAVEGSKTWDDNDNQDGKRPDSITIRLLKNGEEIDQKTVTEEDGWAWSFADLAKFEDGKVINYTVTEDAVAEYSSEVSGYNVINKRTPSKTSVQVTKAWADGNNQDGVRPESVTIKLLADGVETEKTLTLTATNNWTDTFTDLDEYANGQLIEYTVEEVEVENGYVSSVAGTAAEGYTVTNSRTPETIAVEGSKTWDDNDNQDGKRPDSITIHLLKNGAEINSMTVTEEDDWAWSFADLDKFEDGELITYTVTEDAVAEYSSEISGYDVINKHTPGKTSVQVTKAWADRNNQDGVRPESVTIKLFADGVETEKTLTLSATNNWTDTFTDLDEYADGELIEYTVEEVAIGEGYESSVAGTAADGYTVTNSRTPETIAVEGSKTWDDNDNQDGKRPDSITIRLLKNGVEFGQKTVTEEDSWAWNFADLDKFENGELIDYTVTEDAVAEYSSEVSGYNVINKHTPGKTSVQVTKVWSDGDDQDGVRPESVTIKLFADDVETDKTLTLTASNNWTGTFTDLDEYSDGELISYTVEEVAIGEGYTAVVTGDQETGYKVTNIRTPNQPTQPTTPEETSHPTKPSESQPVSPVTRTGESLTMYGWIGALFLGLGLFLIALKRKYRLRRENK